MVAELPFKILVDPSGDPGRDIIEYDADVNTPLGMKTLPYRLRVVDGPGQAILRLINMYRTLEQERDDLVRQMASEAVTIRDKRKHKGE